MNDNTSASTMIHANGNVTGIAKLIDAKEPFAVVDLTFGNVSITIIPREQGADTLAAALIEAGEQLALLQSELALNAESKVVALSD